MQHSVLPQLAVAAAVCQSQLVNGKLSIASLLAQLPNKLISAKVPADTAANLRCLSSMLAYTRDLIQSILNDLIGTTQVE